ncbi:MAG: hypothetical protein JWM74_1902 [Myxococcaceae bacterium]|nr:hypothetical protein [Myxococcaceae bacterium]
MNAGTRGAALPGMKLLGWRALLAVSAGLAAGWTVAFADQVAREAFHARRLDFASLRGLGRGMKALAGGTATTKRAKLRRGIVDTIVSNALFLTLVGDGMRREPMRARRALAAGGVAALSTVPLLPQRRGLLGAVLAFGAGGAAAVLTTALDVDARGVSEARSGSTDRSPGADAPSTHAHLAA